MNIIHDFIVLNCGKYLKMLYKCKLYIIQDYKNYAITCLLVYYHRTSILILCFLTVLIIYLHRIILRLIDRRLSLKVFDEESGFE